MFRVGVTGNCAGIIKCDRWSCYVGGDGRMLRERRSSGAVAGARVTSGQARRAVPS
jgi:hypothetical protein